jgi:succinate dehydrogenase / fumarate reductase cytochrome b subunit
VETSNNASFFARHEFLLRRLHSLSGLIPVGAYMAVHLLTNASVLDSSGSFQQKVYTIHSLGRLLPLVEWGFIFMPLLFHAIFGIVIIRGGLPNTGNYPTTSNLRYTMQRATGMVAFFFIMWHVFHMHGWFHAEPWLKNVAEPLNGAKFRPYNAASTAALAMQQSFLVLLLYLVGVLACVFHLANGLWTMGITWGVWISPAAQRRANYVCGAFGAALAVVGVSAALGLWRMTGEDIARAREVEDRMYHTKVDSGEIVPDEHKRSEDASLVEVKSETVRSSGRVPTDPESSPAEPEIAGVVP